MAAILSRGRWVSTLGSKQNWGPSQQFFFHHNSNSMEILFCSHLNVNVMIVIKEHSHCILFKKIVAIQWPVIKLHKGEFSIKFELWANTYYWNLPLIICTRNFQLCCFEGNMYTLFIVLLIFFYGCPIDNHIISMHAVNILSLYIERTMHLGTFCFFLFLYRF